MIEKEIENNLESKNNNRDIKNNQENNQNNLNENSNDEKKDKSDIIDELGNENITIIPKIVDKIQKIINDPDIPRGLKIKCFQIYEDIFLLSDNSVGEYLPQAMKLIVDGMSSSIEPPSKETDADAREYLGEFREKICELLTGVFMFLTEHNQTHVFTQYIDGFIKYLSKIVEPEFNPSISFDKILQTFKSPNLAVPSLNKKILLDFISL